MAKLYFLVSAFISLLVFNSCDKNESGSALTPTEEPSAWPTEEIRTVKSDLSHPWEMLWGKDDHLWISERAGKIIKVNPKTGYTVFKYEIPDALQRGEGGVLGLVQHPDFLQNGFLYVAYNYLKSGTYTQKLVRFRVKNEEFIEPLTLIDNIPASNDNNGSRLAITADHKLLMTTGDATNSESAQQMNSLSGKVLRINLDGTIPSDNPFPNSAVWTFGHANPQGLVIANGRIFSSENNVGMMDELNLIEKGRNYGWPNAGGPEKNAAAPLWNSGSNSFTVSGIDYYNGDLISRWKNSILMTTLKDGALYQMKLNATGTGVESITSFYQGQWGRLRDVCVSPAGRVYICTGNGEGTDIVIEIQK
jgi:glucose/arabinose dehydrogenase